MRCSQCCRYQEAAQMFVASCLVVLHSESNVDGSDRRQKSSLSLDRSTIDELRISLESLGQDDALDSENRDAAKNAKSRRMKLFYPLHGRVVGWPREQRAHRASNLHLKVKVAIGSSLASKCAAPVASWQPILPDRTRPDQLGEQMIQPRDGLNSGPPGGGSNAKSCYPWLEHQGLEI